MESFELLLDARGAPVLALGARPGDLASEGTVVQVVSLVEEREGGLDFLGE